VDIRSAQKLAWENKNAKGFNTTDVPLEFCFVQGEVNEAFHAWRHSRPDAGEELADIALHLMSLATMTGIDLQAEVEHKIRKNAARVYERDERTGILVRVREGAEQNGSQASPGEWIKPDLAA
jgi:NTP pyrophosphatase (non-canonical NTP hydrolase)